MKHFSFFQIFTVYMFSSLRCWSFCLLFFCSLKPSTVIYPDKAKKKTGIIYTYEQKENILMRSLVFLCVCFEKEEALLFI